MGGWSYCFLALVPWLGGALQAQKIAAPPAKQMSFPVGATFDGQPFTYREAGRVKGRGFDRLKLVFPSPVKTEVVANNRVPAELYLPLGCTGEGPRRPAVICLHILNGNFELTRIVCSALAARGVPALMFPLPYYGERGGPGRGRPGPAHFVPALSQGMLDVRRAFDLLAARPEIDPERIGVSGISLGGMLAATVAGMDGRFHRAALLLAGGDLLRIIDQARECRKIRDWLSSLAPAAQRAAREKIAGHDPLVFAAGLKARAEAGRVLMINAGQDRVVPRGCTEKLAQALGMAGRVKWLADLGHYTAMAALPRILTDTVEFFAADLPVGIKPPRARKRGGPRRPLARVHTFLQGLQAMLFGELRLGRCHYCDLAVDVELKGGKKYAGRIRFGRDGTGQFMLTCKVPKVGAAALGRRKHYWLAAAGKKVFLGSEGKAPESPLAFAAPEKLMRLKVLEGALAGVTMSRAILAQLIKVRVNPNGGLQIVAKGKGKGCLTFAPDGKTPAMLTLRAGQTRCKIEFLAWRRNMPVVAELFAPPAGLAVQAVPARDICRMLAAGFNFIVELAE